MSEPLPKDSTARAQPVQDPFALDQLNETATVTGREIVDVAGFLDEVEHVTAKGLQSVETALAQVQNIAGMRSRMSSAIQSVSQANVNAQDTVDESVARLKESAERSREVAGWATKLRDQMKDVEETLSTVTGSNARITKIAKQITILAINAKIEAARAGEAGDGFAIVAEAVNELSQQTTQAASQVADSVRALTSLISDLRRESTDIGGSAEQVLVDSASADQSLNSIGAQVSEVGRHTREISQAAGELDGAVETMSPQIVDLADSLRETSDGVGVARDRVNALIDKSETIMQLSVRLGATGGDGKMIELVQDRAGEIGRLFEAALKSGEISEQALFTRSYRPIPGSDPEQVMAPFTELTDKILPAVQEPVLELDPRVVFCAAVDTNGYLPTHNLKFGAPQGPDPVWNAANCRNRRIFSDRVGLKAGRNTQPFLLQSYRRDMGGGNFALMNDLSAPIMVGGRHWGGLRLAYKP